MNPSLAGRIRELARRVGYAACGITTADPFPEYERALADRILRFPEAADLYRGLLGRVDPRRTASWARSIVVCVRAYGKYRMPAALEGLIGRNYLFDRRTAACPDHVMPANMTAGLKELGLRLKRGGVPERRAGARAGVTRFGKNTFAYADGCGSWINIESWRVDADLPAGEPTLDPPCPQGCRACMDACPTGAIVEPFVMRCDRCIAHLTYGAPEPVAPELWQRMGTWIYGCDACQLACPLNRHAWRGGEEAPWLEEVVPLLRAEALAEMDQATYESVVHPLFRYIPLDGAERWRRNARRSREAGG